MYYTIRAFFNGEIEELSDEFFFENKQEYLYTRPDKESLNSFLYTISSEIRRQRYYYTAIRMTFFLLCTPAYNMYRRNHGASAQQLLLFFLLYNWIMIQASSSHENLSSRELESFFSKRGYIPFCSSRLRWWIYGNHMGHQYSTHNAQRERVTEGCSGAGSCYLGFCISLSSSSDTFESIYLWLTRLWIVIMSRVSWARCLTYCTSRRSMLGALSAI